MFFLMWGDECEAVAFEPTGFSIAVATASCVLAAHETSMPRTALHAAVLQPVPWCGAHCCPTHEALALIFSAQQTISATRKTARSRLLRL